MYNKHYPSILVPFFWETEHFSGKNRAFWWSILVGKQKHNVQKPSLERDFVNLHNFSHRSLNIVDFQTTQKWEQKLTRRHSSTDEIL